MLPTQENPTFVQHRQVAGALLHELSPHASLILASYCCVSLYIPPGVVLVHTVHGQEQQILQHGQWQQQHLQPKVAGTSTHAPKLAVELQQVVVLSPNVAVHVGPIIFALPGYALLFILLGRNGAIFCHSSKVVCAIPTGDENTSVSSFFTISSKLRILKTIFSS